ncbi:MAG: hypothetical protein CNLJKLNK_00269 [Holosporales bacterium]
MRQKYVALNFLLASLNATDVDLLKPDTTINQIKNFCTLSEEIYNSESFAHRHFLLNQKILPMLSVETYHPLFNEYLKLFFPLNPNDFSHLLKDKLREIALCGIDCLNRCVATLIFIKNTNIDDREALLPIIRSVVKDAHHPYQYHAAHILIQYDNVEDKEAVLPIIRSVVEDAHHSHQFDAAKILIYNGNDEDKEVAFAFIRSIAANTHHSSQFDAADTLIEYGNDEDKEAALAILRFVVKDAHHPHQFDAAQLIRYQESRGRSNSDYTVAAIRCIKSIAENAHHPRQYDAANSLLCYVNDDTAIRCLRSIVKDAHHPRQFDAAYMLMSRRNAEDKESALLIIRSVVKDAHHPKQYEAAQALMYTDNSEDKEAAIRCIKSIAENAHHPRQYNAVRTLIERGNAEDHAFARDVINKMFTEDHNIMEDMKKLLIRNLRESNDPLDQQLGLQLKQRYFPVVFTPETQERMQYFNLDTINKYMPLPLADLSDHNMDIVDELKSIMKRIQTDPAQNSDPFYLDTSIIDRGYTFGEIILRANGFFKTLTGKALNADETDGWQMYDDVKPDMINSMKHIIIALNKQFTLNEPDEIRAAVLSLATVLKGILYCPTGQSEGIENAVNSLVRKTNIAEGDAVALIGKNVIASAVQKAFNNAFYHDGGVHELARARMVLRAHINIPQAIESFKERISRVSDDEIPEFYNKFFDIFTAKFLIQEARRNIQTPSDFDVISDPKQREAAKIIKMERPISVSAIAQWVYEHPLTGEDQQSALTACGIDDEFKSISDEGLIEVLKRMEFISE